MAGGKGKKEHFKDRDCEANQGIPKEYRGRIKWGKKKHKGR